MKIVILGATGRTGKVLVEQALKRGHEVTAIVRDPSKIASAPNLHVIKADVTNPDDLAKAFKGHDALLSTLGSNNTRTQLIERAVQAAIPAMHQNGIQRFIIELSFGAAANERLTHITGKLMHVMLGGMLRDQAAGVALLKKSDLAWTVVFATVLNDGKQTSRVRILSSTEKAGSRHRIARRDVAYFMLESLQNNSYAKQEPIITH